MLIPIGDDPAPERLPPVTGALLIANLLVFALLTLPLTLHRPDPDDPDLIEFVRVLHRELDVHRAGELVGLSEWDLFAFRHGFRSADPTLRSLLLSMFMHANLAHLFANLLFLKIFGGNVEARMGPLRFLAGYLATGVAALLAHRMMFPDTMLPVIGASGCISGVLGFYFVWFPAHRVHMLFWFGFWVNVFSVPARWILGMFLVLDNLLPLLVQSGTGGVAHGAHIGGFLAGALLAQVMRHDTAMPEPEAQPT